jgi:hypothetical protein
VGHAWVRCALTSGRTDGPPAQRYHQTSWWPAVHQNVRRQGDTIPNINGLEVIAQIALGLAGFSGVMIAVAHPSGGFSPPVRFRLRALLYASFGALFLAIIPFAVFNAPWPESTSWRLLGVVMTVYTAGGLLYFPRAAYHLKRGYPELFQPLLAAVQFTNDVCKFLLALAVLFGPSEYQANAYTLVLILLLLQGSIAFMRVLFQRRD